MKKKCLGMLVVIGVVLFLFGAVSASAANKQEGIFRYYIRNDAAVIAGCDTSVSGVIVIPGVIDGYLVTSISGSAFAGCSGLTSIIIPDSVISIGDFAFRGCSGLTSIIIPDGVTSIGKDAFEDCISLTSITIPESVKTIGDMAFLMCNSLETVNIKDLGSWCNIDFKDYYANPLYYAEKLYLDGILVKNLVTPKEVTSIGNNAFYGYAGLESVTICEGVTNIGNRAFAYCINLESVIISGREIIIGEGAFGCCTGLKNLKIQEGVTSIGFEAFYDCGSLTSITIPGSVKTIGRSAFSRCDDIEYAVIDEGVEVVYDYAFFGLYNLKYVVLPSSIKEIKDLAFIGRYIETVFYTGSEDQWNDVWFTDNGTVKPNVVYNVAKKTYKFETNCDTALGDVTDYVLFAPPAVENNGKIMPIWYDNESLSGEPVIFPYFGEATTLYASWEDGTGKSFEDAFAIEVNQQQTETIEKGQLVYFKFMPRESMMYHFYTTGNADTYGYLYNRTKSEIIKSNNFVNDKNFCLSYYLEAGRVYYIAVKLNSGTEGTFTFNAEEHKDYVLNEIDIVDESGNIPSGKFVAEVSLTNVMSDKNALVVLASYTESGEFRGVTYITKTNVPKRTTISVPFLVDNSNGDIAKLKAICLESFRILAPMSDAKTFPAE